MHIASTPKQSIALAVLLCGALAIQSRFGLADIIPDGSLGSRVTVAGDALTIEGGTLAGANLFHSFSSFNVDTGQTATFGNTFQQPLARIISRVTGGEASSIDGVIRLNGSHADLFLMNPAGFTFGPGARLDLPGSMTVTTEPMLSFNDGLAFAADPATPSLLSVAAPADFGFLPAGSAVAPDAAIQFDRAQLVVQAGRNLRFHSHTIESTGATLTAPDGNLALISPKGSQGIVALRDGTVAAVSGTEQGLLHVAGDRIIVSGSFLDARNLGPNPGGAIALDGGNITVTDVSRIRATASDDGDSGGITIQADDFHVINDARIFANNGFITDSGQGAAGTVSIDADNILIDRGLIASSSEAAGPAGRILINVANRLELIGGNPPGSPNQRGQITAAAGRTGGDGSIVINASELIIRDFGLITGSTLSPNGGNASSITINADVISMIAAEGSTAINSRAAASDNNQPAGNAGTITINTRIFKQNGGVVSVETVGPGEGGTITLKASEAILLEPETFRATNGILSTTSGRGNGGVITLESPEIRVSTGAKISGLTQGEGTGGSVKISTGSLTVSKAGDISVSTKSNAPAGTLTIDANQVISQRGRIASTADNGQAGTLTINARDLVLIDGGALPNTDVQRGQINSGAFKNGVGGNVRITTGSLVLQNFGLITATALRDGQAGSISIEADSIVIDGEPGTSIASRAQADNGPKSQGRSGSIDIRTGTLSVRGGGITVESLSRSDGGSITISATESVEVLENGIFSNVRGGGDGGSIMIDSPRLVVGEGARISALTENGGDGGSISLEVGRLQVDTGGLVVADSKSGDGDSGSIYVTSDSIMLDQGRLTSNSNGAGRTGTINVSVTGDLFIDGGRSRNNGLVGGRIVTVARGSGSGGRVTINAGNITLIDAGLISATTRAEANAGSVDVRADSVSLIDQGSAIVSRSTRTDPSLPSGNGGDVTVVTDSLLMRGGILGTDTLGQGRAGTITLNVNGQAVVASDGSDNERQGIFSNTEGPGDGGLVAITAGTLIITDSARVTAGSTVGGNGGNVMLNADRLIISNGAQITAASTGAGRAGSVNVAAVDSFDLIQSNIQTVTASADGGDIVVMTGNILQLVDSSIETSVAGGSGSGGNIFASPQFFILNNSRIRANAFVGSGGNIQITAGQIFSDAVSVIEASSALGIDGDISVEAPDTDVTAGLVVIEGALLDTNAVLAQQCNAQRTSAHARFRGNGRGGVSVGPGQHNTPSTMVSTGPEMVAGAEASVSFDWRPLSANASESDAQQRLETIALACK